MKRPTLGFSMIEVLVSLVLICVGVLGVAALQSKAVPFTQDSVNRSTAIMLTNDLLELIRSNPTAVTAYLKAPGTAFATAPASCLPTPTSPSDQLACWAARAQSLLPGAGELLTSTFYICRNAVPGLTGATASCDGGNYLEIQVAWSSPGDTCLDDAATTAGPAVCTVRIRTQL